ncbi:MAG TPA: ABC transporter permease [Vicinamibacterales bacterium]|nr:ABC transporter permease [Vicinamibacterales bacterium]
MPHASTDWKQRIRAALSRTRRTPDDDVIEELAGHAQAMYQAARADGDSHEDAARRVDLQIAVWAGDAATLQRPRGRTPSLEPPPSLTGSRLAGLGGDCRYALRVMRRRAALSTIVVATIALGVAATTTLFSVAYSVLFRPLPWAGADRLVVVKETRGGRAPRFNDVSNAVYHAWREGAETIDGLAAWTPRTVTMSGHGDAERLAVAAVTPGLFPLLGMRPLAGTLLEPRDGTGHRGAVVVIAESLWRQRFGADPRAVGRTVRIDGVPHTVVGVLPDRQAFPDRLTRAWIPLEVPAAAPTSMSMYKAVARLRPGATAAQAAGEATARAAAAPQPIEMLTMALYGGTGAVDVSLVPLREAQGASFRPALLVFLAAVGLLFATAMANVASLLLARATTRGREIAIRAALGAGAPRVVRQLLVESLLLSVVAGAAGLVLTGLLHLALPSVLSPDFVVAHDVRLHLPVLAFGIALSLVTGVVIGLLPAVRVRRSNMVEALAHDGLALAGAARGSWTARTRLLIMAGQVAIACVLLVAASLLGRSFMALGSADRGYDPAHLLTAWVPMPSPAFSPQARAEFAGGLVERLRRVPGVQAVAYADAPPTGAGSSGAFTMDGRTVHAEQIAVTPSYFAAMGMRLVDGRPFTDEDAVSARPVLVVNRTFARQYLEGGGAGVSVRAGLFPGAPPAEVIGIVEDVRHRPEAEARPQVFLVQNEQPGTLDWSGVTILARTLGDPAALAPTLRAAAREQNGAVALGSVMTMEERVRTGLEGQRVSALLISGFASLALLIAAVGLFGVLSYTVAQRSRELAVRTALGARPGDLMRLVLRQGLGTAALGVAAGLPAAFALTRVMGATLYGVGADDPLTYVAVPLVLLTVALAACAAPAVRASRVDPLRVLKAE